MTRAEIWMSGMTNPTYIINEPKRVEMSEDNISVRITDEEGWSFETSPNNVVIIKSPKEVNQCPEQ